ncbi:MAG: hypothetical protein AABY01_00125 [Nanoarchaeota archaeon]
MINENVSRRLLDEKEDHLARASYFEFAGLAGLLMTGTVGGIAAAAQFADNQPVAGTVVGALTGIVSYGILRATHAISQSIMSDYSAKAAQIRAEYTAQ